MPKSQLFSALAGRRLRLALDRSAATDRQGTMSSDTSATGKIPALGPEAFPAARASRQVSGLAALAPGPARDAAAQGLSRPAPGEPGPSGRDQDHPGSAG